MKQNKQKVSLSQIDNLLLEVERFNPSLQERVLDLVDNPTQCPTQMEESINRFEGINPTPQILAHIHYVSTQVWDHCAQSEERLSTFKNIPYECCSCHEWTISPSILCDDCWLEEFSEGLADHMNSEHSTYWDNGIEFFIAGPIRYSPTNHFFTLR